MESDYFYILKRIEEKLDRVLVFIAAVTLGQDFNVQDAIADLEKQQKEIHSDDG